MTSMSHPHLCLHRSRSGNAIPLAPPLPTPRVGAGNIAWLRL